MPSMRFGSLWRSERRRFRSGVSRWGEFTTLVLVRRFLLGFPFVDCLGISLYQTLSCNHLILTGLQPRVQSKFRVTCLAPEDQHVYSFPHPTGTCSVGVRCERKTNMSLLAERAPR